MEQIPVHYPTLEREAMETTPIMLNIVTEIQPDQNNFLALINEVRGRSYMCGLRGQGYDEGAIHSEYNTKFQPILNYPKGAKYDPIEYYDDKAIFKGLILVVPAIVLAELQTRKSKEELISILNHRDFLDSILGHVLVAYDPTRKIVELYDVCVYKASGRGTGTIIMTNVLDALLVQFPNDALIWLGVILEPKMFEAPLKLYTRMGFSNPYITNRTPIGSVGNKEILALYRQNDYIDPDEINTEDARILIEYVIREYQSHVINPRTCNAYAYFKPATGRYLRSLAKAASTQDISGKITQKEVAGALNLNKVVRAGESLLYEIIADKKTISTGEGEAVDAVAARYTYHTHPRSAYITHNVRIAWPSAQDYVGFAHSVKNFGTVFHLVVSLEGIYVIKLTKEFLDLDVIAELPKAYGIIKEKYNLLYPSVTVTPLGQEISCQVAYPGQPCTGADYVGIVNQDDFRIRQDIPRIFDVSFLSWEDVVRPVPFSFVFPRIFDVNNPLGNCFVSSDNIDSFIANIPR